MARLITLAALTVWSCAAAAQTADLLISEYVEGSGYHKAVEIYNGTDDPVDLADYAIERYSNGSTTATVIPLDAVELASGEVYVVAHNLFPVGGIADQLSADLNFNGNDALVLTLSGVPVDRIGRVGEDPGSYWSCASGTTQNHTLVRKAGVCSGETDPTAVFDPCVGWEFLASDTLDDLGSHDADCGTVGAPDLRWGDLKAAYR